MDPIWTQSHLRTEKSRRECSDGSRERFVGVLRPTALCIVSQQHRGIVADPLRDGMHWNAGIQQGRGVNAPQIVKSNAAKSDDVGTAGEFFAELRGLRPDVNEKSEPGEGTAGNISASAASRTSAGTTSEPSGTPAQIRK